jgi:hypothetical protein
MMLVAFYASIDRNRFRAVSASQIAGPWRVRSQRILSWKANATVNVHGIAIEIASVIIEQLITTKSASEEFSVAATTETLKR